MVIFLNKGALTKTYNYHIFISGLNLSVNGVDTWMGEIYGQRGHVSFVWIKDLTIEHFRCTDLSSGHLCIQICTFEDVLINDVIIKGKKDAIHFGRGKRFRISNGIFQTADDAIALAAGDWISGNPELTETFQQFTEIFAWLILIKQKNHKRHWQKWKKLLP